MTMLRRSACLLTGLLALAATSLMSSGVDARFDHPVDEWLAAHPKVADNLIWEFPPPVPYSKPAAAASTQWTRYTVVPYPSTIPALSLDVFASTRDSGATRGGDGTGSGDTRLDPIRSDETRLDLSLAMLNEGLDPGRIESALPPLPKFTKVPKKVVLPGFKLDFVPSGEQVSDQGGDIRAWPQWYAYHQQQLRDRFDDYLPLITTACALYGEYAASGFAVKPAGFDAAFSSLVDTDPVPLVDPPVNLQPDDPFVPGAPWTMLDSEPAFELYVRLVAAQLAMEIGGCLPWSVEDYTGAELGLLFDGRTSLRYGAAGASSWGMLSATGHVSVGNVIPAPPMKVLGFLGQEKILAPTRLETVWRFLDWERTHLAHVYGGAPNPPLPTGVNYWGHDGRAPVSRMLEARVMQVPVKFSGGYEHFDPVARHWVAGCGGASGFNAEVLRVLNIPVERTFYGHQQNRFSVGVNQRVSTAHGDDPYGMVQAPEVPIGELLLDEPTFDAWFVNVSDPVVLNKNVARWTVDLWFKHLPVTLLKRHCADVANNKAHADSFVMSTFASAYTVAEMEAKGLWDAIEDKIISMGNCVALGFGGVVIP